MNRTLTRLRFATGDPLLVRACRGLAPTSRGAELRDRAHALTREAKVVLRLQPSQVDVASLERTFAIRASEGFLEILSTLVVAAVSKTEPHVRPHFLAKPDRDARPLFPDRFVGVARWGHPVLSEAEITPQRYAAFQHVAASREGEASKAIDGALYRLGLSRTVMVVVPPNAEIQTEASPVPSAACSNGRSGRTDEHSSVMAEERTHPRQVQRGISRKTARK